MLNSVYQPWKQLPEPPQSINIYFSIGNRSPISKTKDLNVIFYERLFVAHSKYLFIVCDFSFLRENGNIINDVSMCCAL